MLFIIEKCYNIKHSWIVKIWLLHNPDTTQHNTTKCDENIKCLKSINCYSALIRTKSEIIK